MGSANVADEYANGYARGSYVFMSLDTVNNDIYSGTEISYYRPTRSPADPSVDPSSECYDEYRSGEALPEADPLVLAGYRRLGAPLTPLGL